MAGPSCKLAARALAAGLLVAQIAVQVAAEADPRAVEQQGAQIPAGGEVRWYSVGSSNGAWQTWPDQLHSMLLDLGYNVTSPNLTVPGATTQPMPGRHQICDNEPVLNELETPRMAMVGWSSWGFAYESFDECQDGYRTIAGYPVKCINSWACNPKYTNKVTDLVRPSVLAAGVRPAHFVVLSNWINDGKTAHQAVARANCMKNVSIDFLQSTALTRESLTRTITAIHKENPDILILVMARYSEVWDVVYPDGGTLPEIRAINGLVKNIVEALPKTVFVDINFPMNVSMFQNLSRVHPNCRGDRVMATRVLETLYEQKVLARNFALGDETTCLGNGACATLDHACCQRSALCILAANGTCVPYGPGVMPLVPSPLV